MILLALPAFAQQTDTLGGYDASNDEGDMLKLIDFEVDEAVVLTEVEFAVANERSQGEVWIVLYEGTGRDYVLVASVEVATLPPSGEWSWVTSGDVEWLLDPGHSYSVGAWLSDSWFYYYADYTDDPWFGTVHGSFRVDAGSVPEGFEAPELEAYYYYTRLTSIAADEDGDGASAERWGGEDCDDVDAAVHPGAEEVCEDGLDNDCREGDEACGEDTDEPQDSGDTDLPDDTDDTDDTDLPDDTDDTDVPDERPRRDDGVPEGEVDVSRGCACDGTGGGATLLWAVGALALARRRRA